MKKILAIASALLLTLSLAACGSTADNTETQQETEAETTVAEKTPTGGLGQSSLDTSWITNQYTGIAYGTQSDTQTLDIYLPEEESSEPYPVIVAFHGGAFMLGSSTGGDVSSMIEGVNYGYAVVSVNYRLSGEAIFPAAINDAKAAIRWIKANAEEYNLDAENIAVWGGSAGGNIAAMLGTTGDLEGIGENDNLENLEYSSAVQAVVDWFGPLDFLAMDQQFEESGITRTVMMGVDKTSSENSPESKYIGQLITLDEELTQQANPATYVNTMDASDAPSFFVEHGTADGNVPTQQSVDFAELLKEALGEDKVGIELIDGAGHGTSEFGTQENLDKVFSFLDGVLK
ncbi:alpha/beta hydrolase [Parasporobacterium paucivorans]|uniref:Acetyl esterase/lipase n=1 Tax=Parasporobacterium paucivorans DSM 15970 TaxID=1122934 RepID=A0A1M6K0M0_9FIRM|nr:alpha/beta hydrolase [Parasporobacterium paucivorans]SHJ52434.1 Acetyl esterase/lipase [Parasporobacterium paucivorans DSM 15970]